MLIPPFFKIKKECACIFVLSLFSGFPSNSKYAKELFDKNIIDDNKTINNVKLFDSITALKLMLYQKKINNSAWGKLYNKSVFENIMYPVGKIYEDISIIVSKNELLGKIADAIKNTSEYIKHVKIKDIYQGDKIDQQKQSVTFQVLFEDIENRLNRDSIETFKKEIIKSIKKFDAILRDF